MKKLLIAATAALCLGVGGCAQVDQFETWFTSSKNQATIKLLEAQTVVFVCDVSAVSGLVGQVAQAAQADASFIGTTGKVYAASTVACTGLGGILGTQVTAPAGAQVVQ